MNISRAIMALTAVSVGAAFVACDTPDPQGRFDEFGTLTEDYRNVSTTNNQPNNSVQVDFSGRYFLSIVTPLLPTPLFFDTTVEVDASFNAKFVFQPLKTDLEGNAARADARTPVGDPIVVENVAINEDGTFLVELTDAAVSGAANPISGGDIVATLQLSGFVTSTTAFCGTVSGQVSQPTQLTLDGSSFGTVLIEADDLTLIEPSAKCEAGVLPMDDAGMDASDAGDMDNDMGTPPKVRCPSDLAGDYLLTFKADVQSARSQVEITLAESTDDTLCYTGEVKSLTTAEKIGDVEFAREADGAFEMLIPNFAIPPGATPLLPDGGESRLALTATHWTTEGSCGELNFSLSGLPVMSDGDFAVIRKDSTKFTITDSETAATCSAIVPTQDCGMDAYVGTYNLRFLTETTKNLGGEPTTVSMELATHPLTCLQGKWVSLTSGDTLATVQMGEKVDPDQVSVTIRNFVIPPNPDNPIPFLRNGGLADATLTSTASTPGTDMCGTMAFSLVEPIQTTSPATFSANSQMEPATAECP